MATVGQSTPKPGFLINHSRNHPLLLSQKLWQLRVFLKVIKAHKVWFTNTTIQSIHFYWNMYMTVQFPNLWLHCELQSKINKWSMTIAFHQDSSNIVITAFIPPLLHTLTFDVLSMANNPKKKLLHSLWIFQIFDAINRKQFSFINDIQSLNKFIRFGQAFIKLLESFPLRRMVLLIHNQL